MNLIEKSIKLVKESQLKSGIMVGSHINGAYNCCFLKDNSFSVYALDIIEEYEIGDKYYNWSSKKIIELEYKIRDAIRRYNNNETLLNSDYLHSIYDANGIEDEQRSNFQLDGYGVWLWGICQHIKITERRNEKYIKSIRLIAEYLECFWQSPCFGCWEEKDDRIHTSTLACIYGGLKEASDIIESDQYRKTTNKIKKYILTNCVRDGKFSKYAFHDDIDSSLLFLTLPFNVIEVTNDIMVETISQIEKNLLDDNGLHRYSSDSYYGGGRWINLTCWLAWYYKKVGKVNRANQLIEFVENCSNSNMELPEQIIDKVYNREYIVRWQEIFGDVICPSIWAHAMYIITKMA